MKRLIGALAGAAVVLAGCSSSGSGASTESGASTDLSKLTLTMWVAQASATQAKQPAQAFEAKTGAKVNIVVVQDPYEGTVATRLATGDKPDLAFYQPTQAALSTLQPSNRLLPLDSEPWVSTLGKLEQTIGIANGVRYAAIVKPPSVSGVYYNKAVFTEAGITAVPASWDAMIEAAGTIKRQDPAVAPFYQAGADKWPLQWPLHALLSGVLDQTFWNELNTNKAKWTDPRILDAVTKYKTDLVDSGLSNADYKTGTFENQAAALASGKAAMAFQTDALTPLLLSNMSVTQLDERIGWFPISAKGADSQFSADQTNGVVAFKTGDGKREAATKAFLTFWLGEGYPQYLAANKFASVEPAVPSPDGLPKVTQAQIASSPTATGMYYIYAIATPSTRLYLNDMLFGAKTPAQVVQAMQAEFVTLARAKGATGF